MQDPFTSDASVVVFEKRTRWTPELQRQFLGTGVGVFACQSLADVGRRLQAADRFVVVLLDLEAAPAEVLRCLESRAGQGEGPSHIVVAGPRWAELEWRVRELGAVDFIVDAISGQEMAQRCRRQWETDTTNRRTANSR